MTTDPSSNGAALPMPIADHDESNGDNQATEEASERNSHNVPATPQHPNDENSSANNNDNSPSRGLEGKKQSAETLPSKLTKAIKPDPPPEQQPFVDAPGDDDGDVAANDVVKLPGGGSASTNGTESYDMERESRPHNNNDSSDPTSTSPVQDEVQQLEVKSISQEEDTTAADAPIYALSQKNSPLAGGDSSMPPHAQEKPALGTTADSVGDSEIVNDSSETLMGAPIDAPSHQPLVPSVSVNLSEEHSKAPSADLVVVGDKSVSTGRKTPVDAPMDAPSREEPSLPVVDSPVAQAETEEIAATNGSARSIADECRDTNGTNQTPVSSPAAAELSSPYVSAGSRGEARVVSKEENGLRVDTTSTPQASSRPTSAIPSPLQHVSLSPSESGDDGSRPPSTQAFMPQMVHHPTTVRYALHPMATHHYVPAGPSAAVTAAQIMASPATAPQVGNHPPVTAATLPLPVMQSPQMNGGGAGGGGGRRKIKLHLQEGVPSGGGGGGRDHPTFLGHIRQQGSRMFGSDALSAMNKMQQIAPPSIDRGYITVSWFEGTSSLELQEHVRRSVKRKLGMPPSVELTDMRILDQSVDPPEEIVLSPFIPDGSKFLLCFGTRDDRDDGTATPVSMRPPDSPSAAPLRSSQRGLDELSNRELALLRNQLTSLRGAPSMPNLRVMESTTPSNAQRRAPLAKPREGESSVAEESRMVRVGSSNGPAGVQDRNPAAASAEDEMVLHSEDPIEARLREITELLISDKMGKKHGSHHNRRTEKRQVIFVLANYFVLFISLIAISAEIQARAPSWLAWMEARMTDVQNCAENQDALFECVSNGDFAGLLASVILWLSRSASTHQVFLFGFESQKKLWTVVYESGVTAVCWGVSYLFIRRGMNPDTRRQFLQKYWKDAVYGSLAGFNAAFMKHVLKNLIPQEAVEDAFKERQLKFLNWLPSFG